MSLAGKIAVVTGASRGIGKGIAIGLGYAGATVYVTGRSLKPNPDQFEGTIGETADEVTKAGGKGIAVACDHSDDDAVKRLFERVQADYARLDILVNNAATRPDKRSQEARMTAQGFGSQSGAKKFTGAATPKDFMTSLQSLGTGFWDMPLSDWDENFNVGVRSHYVASHFAARMMIPKRSGLIVNVSSPAAVGYAKSVAFGTAKAALDRVTADTALELKPHGVSVISIWPGMVKTEKNIWLAEKGAMDMATAESPLLSGRAVVALAEDPHVIERSGQAVMVTVLARDYGFVDVNGQPPPIEDLNNLVAVTKTSKAH